MRCRKKSGTLNNRITKYGVIDKEFREKTLKRKEKYSKKDDDDESQFGKFKIRTGDIIICSSNTSTGIGLKTLTSSMWNHSGIAVRISEEGIVNDDSGKLYLLEINTSKRIDNYINEEVEGCGYSDFKWMTERYNMISVRRMLDKYRTPEFIQRLDKFVEDNRHVKFTENIGPFLSVLTGILLHERELNKDTMFCSEFMANLYKYCFQLKFDDIFQRKELEHPEFFSPYTFSSEYTPNSPFFESNDNIIHVSYSDIGCVLIPVASFTLFFFVLIDSFLRKY